MAKKDDIVHCTYCGGEMNRRAKACPHCGSDDRTGWSDDTYLDGIDLPNQDSYEDLLNEEFGQSEPQKKSRLTWKLAIGVLLLIVLMYIAFRGF